MTNVDPSKINRSSESYKQPEERTTLGSFLGHIIKKIIPDSKPSKEKTDIRSLFERIVDKIVPDSPLNHKISKTEPLQEGSDFKPVIFSGTEEMIQNPSKIIFRDDAAGDGDGFLLVDIGEEGETAPISSSQSSLESLSQFPTESPSSTSPKASDQGDEVSPSISPPTSDKSDETKALAPQKRQRVREVTISDPIQVPSVARPVLVATLTSEKKEEIEAQIKKLKSEMSEIKDEMKNAIAKWRENPTEDTMELLTDLKLNVLEFSKKRGEAFSLMKKLSQSSLSDVSHKASQAKRSDSLLPREFNADLLEKGVYTYFFYIDATKKESAFLAHEFIAFLTEADPKKAIETLKTEFLKRIEAKQESGSEHIVTTYFKEHYNRTVDREVNEILHDFGNLKVEAMAWAPLDLHKPIAPGKESTNGLELIRTDEPLEGRILSENEEKREEIVYVRPLRQQCFSDFLIAIADYFDKPETQVKIKQFLESRDNVSNTQDVRSV